MQLPHFKISAPFSHTRSALLASGLAACAFSIFVLLFALGSRTGDAFALVSIFYAIGASVGVAALFFGSETKGKLSIAMLVSLAHALFMALLAAILEEGVLPSIPSGTLDRIYIKFLAVAYPSVGTALCLVVAVAAGQRLFAGNPKDNSAASSIAAP